MHSIHLVEKLGSIHDLKIITAHNGLNNVPVSVLSCVVGTARESAVAVKTLVTVQA